jgi:hypothetical protein
MLEVINRLFSEVRAQYLNIALWFGLIMTGRSPTGPLCYSKVCQDDIPKNGTTENFQAVQAPSLPKW